MFLMSTNSAASLPRTWQKASSEMEMPPRLGDSFEPRGDVDAVAENVGALDQHIAEMNADPPLHAAVAGDRSIALFGLLLQCEDTLHAADHRAKLDQDPVAGRLDDPSAMSRNERLGGSMMLA